VIAGQGTAALELFDEVVALDALIVPIGGGGLVGGSAIAARAIDPGVALYAAEPAGAADAYESLRRGERVTDIVADTICDGLSATIGEINLDLLRRHAVEVLPVADTDTVAAMKLVWQRLKQLVEPSSATVLAAVLAHPDRFTGRRVGVILSGGNVDAGFFGNLPS
jgi:threonine dehydratase